MKKFKRIFYFLYIIFFCFGGVIAFNYEKIVLKWDWDFIDTWAGLLRFVLKLGAFGLVLFLVEIIIENIHIFGLTNKIKKLENEVLDLKGKLYDKKEAQESTSSPENDETAPKAEE